MILANPPKKVIWGNTKVVIFPLILESAEVEVEECQPGR